MITINVIDNKICGSYGDTPFAVDYTKDLYNEMLSIQVLFQNVKTIEDYNKLLEDFAKLTVVDYKKTIQTKCEHIYVNSAGEFFLKHGETISKIPMPEALVERIYESMDKDLDFSPLIKMWTRFLRNPVLKTKMKKGWGKEFCERFFNFVNMKYVHPKLKSELMEDHGLTEEAAEKRATMYQMKITQEGLLNGYKVSKEILHKYNKETGEEEPRYTRTFNPDTGEIESNGLPEFVEDRLFQPSVMGNGGDAFFCEGPNGYATPQHFIKVGCTHRLESWDQVNTNDRRSCVKGLHIGGLKYISWYTGEIHNIFVDPMHIGAVPDDEDGAIRCKQYFVHSSLAGVNGSIYHSSSYAAMTDTEWNEMRKKAVETYSKDILDIQSNVEALRSL
tara:strand:+ start:934 stop:2100 length:1167 start_codon:yes stop_codon:yes gene_type:complete